MSYGSVIKRGPMAGDHFTQISNALFRDRRISAKAKGIFGLISTHRAGWRLTVVDMARHLKEGRDAIYSALKELETHGYLTREQERRGDGTLGEMTYAITDVPAHLVELLGEEGATAALAVMKQNRRSEPLPGFPDAVDPDPVDPRTKNTNNQNPKNQNTKAGSTRPSVPRPRASSDATSETDGRTGGEESVKAAVTDGVDFLVSFGAAHPTYVLTGKTLQDQGRRVDELLAVGWKRTHIRSALTSRPLPEAHELRQSPGAVISRRLRDAAAGPVPALYGAAEWKPSDHSSTGAADKTVDQAQAGRTRRECEGDDKMCRAPLRGEGRFCAEHKDEENAA